MSKQKFRLLIVVNWLLVVAYVVVSITTESLLPSELRSYLDAQLNAPITTSDIMLFAVVFIYFISYIAVSIGVFLFKKWAKTLLLPSIAIASILLIIGGPYIETGLASFCSYFLNLIEGIILALVYFSPIRKMFEID